MLYGNFSTIDFDTISGALEYSLRFLRDRAAGLADGRHELPEGMYAEIKSYSPAPANERFFESHVRYVDVQCVLEGEEKILARAVTGMSIKEDKLEKADIAFYHEPDGDDTQFSLIMRPGIFLLLLPEDAHKTECRTSVSSARKVIFKIPVRLLY